jgi:hypothetical protein
MPARAGNCSLFFGEGVRAVLLGKTYNRATGRGKFPSRFDRGRNMSKSVPKAPAECVALYDALLATNPAIQRKGATMPYTSVNGNMFSLLTPDGDLALRLPEADREAFLKRYETGLCEQYGVVMKEYVRVPPSVLQNTRALAKYLDISYRYACSLKPKPTKRKPTAKKGKADRRA